MLVINMGSGQVWELVLSLALGGITRGEIVSLFSLSAYLIYIISIGDLPKEVSRTLAFLGSSSLVDEDLISKSCA